MSNDFLTKNSAWLNSQSLIYQTSCKDIRKRKLEFGASNKIPLLLTKCYCLD